jgi:hypothetical protein
MPKATPVEQRTKAAKTRGLIKPDSDAELFMAKIVNRSAAAIQPSPQLKLSDGFLFRAALLRLAL